MAFDRRIWTESRYWAQTTCWSSRLSTSPTTPAFSPPSGNVSTCPGSYLILGCTGARPAEVVDNEKNKPKDGSWEDLWGPNPIEKMKPREDKKSDDKVPDQLPGKNSTLLEEMLMQETEGRGRPKALCYEDILLMVVRPPETGKDALAMTIKFIHHKGSDNKPKPTIFFFTTTRRLIFCPILAIISLALADGAFAARNLVKASDVLRARNRGPQTLGAGFQEPIGPKAFRRGAANAANGTAPDAVRDQMMRHDPKGATFNSAYINEKVELHLQNAFLDEPMEDGLIKLFTHISIMRDPRASYDMVPDEVLNSLPPDPEICSDDEKGLRQLTSQIRTKRAQRRKALRQEYRKYYFYNRPTWDIERQASQESDEEDGDEGEDNYLQPAIELHIPERARLAEISCHQPDNLNSTELQNLRIEATQLMTALCSKRETVKRKYIRRATPANVPMLDETDVSIKQEVPELDRFPLLMEKTQCPCGIGSKAISEEERTFRYCRPAVMNDHLDREHLKPLKAAERSKSIICEHPGCRDGESLDHFRNHVQRVYGVRLRPERR
ncbi:hypothetical protein IL306_007721 [Fusarium sp. DS 682]|nr:hypothetical protein IL306_007721 [Fusarium sp. DS 682]